MMHFDKILHTMAKGDLKIYAEHEVMTVPHCDFPERVALVVVRGDWAETLMRVAAELGRQIKIQTNQKDAN